MVVNKNGKWVLSVLLWVWTGTFYFFTEVIWKTANGRPETISWTMLLLAIFLAVPLERFGAELPWNMPLLLQSELMAWPWCLGLLSHAREHSRSNLPAIYLRVVSSVNFCNRYARLDEVQC